MGKLSRFLLLLLFSLLSVTASAVQDAAPTADIEAFVHEGCPHCAKAQVFLAQLQQEQPGLRIVIRDVGKEEAAMQRLQQIAASHGPVRVPTFYIGERIIVGYSAESGTDRLIRDTLAKRTQQSREFSVTLFGNVLTLEQIGLPLFTLTLGLLDGFNPGSMWVLLLMLSLLAPLNDRKRMFAVAGTFIAVQGIAYFLFLAAWLNLFLLVGLSRISEIVIAALALFAGAVNLKDFFAFGRGLSLSIPQAAKPGIYQRMRNILQARNLAAAIVATIVLGVLVQFVELMCTSGFPALFTRILTQSELDGASYYGYLLLYDLAYMLDDLLILAVGVYTLSQHRLQEKEGRVLKLLSGVVMVGLGVYLLLP